MNITIIGTGYVGLVTGACLAELGHNVICVDKDIEKITQLNVGLMPIYEPGLEKMVAKNVENGRLDFATDVAETVGSADIVFLAVGTPTSRRGDGYADLTYVYEVAEEVAEYLEEYTVVIIKSTVPAGTAQQVTRIISGIVTDASFDVASNPEFLREGRAIEDFMLPDRIVIGIEDKNALSYVKEVYKELDNKNIPMIITSTITAELIKYASNAFLATKISFINEMSGVCEAVGADITALAKGMGMDVRIGPEFLKPGPGYGGSCFPKDTVALLRTAQEWGAQLRVVGAAVEANSAQKAFMVKKIRDALGGSESGKIIAVLGLTFKPDTDDMRDSPAVSILPALLEKGAVIKTHDPQGMEEANKYLPDGIRYAKDAYEACDGADAVVLMTEWSEYRELNLGCIYSLLNNPEIFIDLRNLYDPQVMKRHGFTYISIGRD